MKNVRTNIMYNSCYAILGGLALDMAANTFSFQEPIFTTVLKIGGVIGLTYYGMTLSKFTRIFENLQLGVQNVYPIQVGCKTTDISKTYKFTLPTGLAVSQIESKKEPIEQWLGKKVKIAYINRGLFIIEVFLDSSDKMYDYDETLEVDGDIAFPMGYDVHGKLVTCCLSSGGNYTHMMIAGSTGGGKSVLLKVILTYLITKKSVDMYLVDLKGTELSIYENCSCVKDICYDCDSAIRLFKELTAIMQKRYETFRNNGVRDIKAYNKMFKHNKMKYIVVAIDEFSELMEDNESQRELERLSALSRSAGISIIVSTQRPDSKVVSSRIKNNFMTVAGLKTNTDINSRIIMDNDSLTDLRGNGHCILRYENKDWELQGMFISDDQIEQLIKAFTVKKVKIKPKTMSEDQSYDIDSFDFLRELSK